MYLSVYMKTLKTKCGCILSKVSLPSGVSYRSWILVFSSVSGSFFVWKMDIHVKYFNYLMQS